MGPCENSKRLLQYLGNMNFSDCLSFSGEQGKKAMQLVHDFNAGEIKSAYTHIKAGRRFRSFNDQGLVFVVRTR